MNARIKKFFVLFGVIIVLFIIGLYKNADMPKQEEYLTAFSKVLFSADSFVQIYPKMDSDMTLAEIYKVKDELEMKEENRTFALCDLDDDGTPELILPLAMGDSDSIYGFEILHYTDGDVLGYILPYRAFYPLKEDGTFSSSGGATDWEICSISAFTRQTYCTNVHLQIQTSGSFGTNMIYSYYVNGQEVNENIFDEAVTEWDDREDVVFKKLSKQYW